jgi:hypothetical protein
VSQPHLVFTETSMGVFLGELTGTPTPFTSGGTSVPSFPSASDQFVNPPGDVNLSSVHLSLPTVSSVAGRVGDVVIAPSDLAGLSAAIEDRVASLFAAGTQVGATISHDPTSHSLSVSVNQGSSSTVMASSIVGLPALVSTTVASAISALTYVTSVNSHTGDVSLGASDVGADVSGAASSAVAYHEAAADPHPQYLTQSESDLRVAAGISSHVSASDPHTGYLLKTGLSSALATLGISTSAGLVSSVNSHSGAVTLTASDVGATPASHLVDSDPHPQYITPSEVDTKVSSGISTHTSATDPHPQYTSDAEATALANACVATHEAATDPHPQYTSDAEATALANACVATHEAATDPHSQYTTVVEAKAAAAAALEAGTHTGISVTHDSGTQAISLSVTPPTIPDPTLAQSITLVGTSLGAQSAGYTFLAGMTLTQVLSALAVKVIPPTYSAATLSFSPSPAPTNTEIGSTVAVTFTLSYTQHDAGATNARRVLRAGTPVALANTATSYSDSVTVTGTSFTYQAQVDFDQGPILNNNVGTPDATGRISAGTLSSSTYSYIGKRVAFYGTPSSPATTTAGVRALGASTFSTDNNTTVDAAGTAIGTLSPSFSIVVPVGATRVVFAYPATSRSVATVKYAQLSDSEVKGNFTETLVNVEGAAGYAPIAYRVFTYTPVEAFSQTATYKVFI